MRTKVSTDGHIEFNQLLQALDGELPDAEARMVRAHLDACWSCHARMNKLRETVAEVVEYQDLLTEPYVSQVDQRKTMFLAQLRDLAKRSKTGPVERMSAALHFLARVPTMVSPAGWIACSAGLALVSFFLWAPAHISARTLLDQAVRQESVTPPSMQIEHRTIRLEERDEDGMLIATSRIESWNDRSQSARRLFDEQGRVIGGEWVRPDGSHMLFERSQLRRFGPSESVSQVTLEDIWRISPSAATFSALVGATTTKVEQHPAEYILRQDGRRTFGAVHVVRASLTLRRNDLHATEQRMSVEREGRVNDFRLVETAYEQRPVALLPGALELDASLATLGVPPSLALAGRPIRASAMMEVEALHRLDQVDAFAKDQMKVERDRRGPLKIEGMVATDERRREVIEALGPLASNPSVSIHIRTAAEALKQIGNNRHVQVQAVEVETSGQEMNPDLQRYVSSTMHVTGKQLDDEVQRYTFQLLGHIEEAQSQALVLRQLAAVLSSSDRDELTGQARKQWQDLLQSHAQRVKTEMSFVRKELAPVLYPTGVPTAVPTPKSESIDEAIAQLCQLSTMADNALWKAFAIGSDPASGSRIKTREFWESLSNAEQLAIDIGSNSTATSPK